MTKSEAASTRGPRRLTYGNGDARTPTASKREPQQFVDAKDGTPDQPSNETRGPRRLTYGNGEIRL